MHPVVAGRLRNFARRGRNFFTRAGSFFATCQPNFYNQPAELLQPTADVFAAALFFYFTNADFFTSLAAHTMSLSRMANHGPAKQPRDRGLIVIVTIGQPSNPATAG